MKSHLYHLQLNIDFKNLRFYKKLFVFLGWSIIFEEVGTCGYKSGSDGDIWLVDCESRATSDFDNRGVNHIALRVEDEKDINAAVDFLSQQKVELLFDTPKHRPEFAENESQTYYQIMFKTVDNILFEIVYVGSK